MFTSHMSDKEILAEGKRDFLEMIGRVRISFDQFIKKHRRVGGMSMMHSVVESKTYRTRQYNVWTIQFKCVQHKSNGDAVVAISIYAQLPCGNRTDYIFLRLLDRCLLERFTSHFLQRYKERFLIPRNIQMEGVRAASYYLQHNEDRQLADYYCRKSMSSQEIIDKDIDKKNFWISNQGITVSKYEEGVFTYITFLDEENLTRTKRLIYEEEQVWQDLEKLTKTKNAMEKYAIYTRLTNDPETLDKLERYLRRVGCRSGNIEEAIEQLKEYWETIVKEIQAFDKLFAEKVKQERIQKKIVQRSSISIKDTTVFNS